MGFGFELRSQLGKLRRAVRKLSNLSLEARRKALCAQAIRFLEILLAYTCIFLIESACMFPAVWVR